MAKSTIISVRAQSALSVFLSIFLSVGLLTACNNDDDGSKNRDRSAETAKNQKKENRRDTQDNQSQTTNQGAQDKDLETETAENSSDEAATEESEVEAKQDLEVDQEKTQQSTQADVETERFKLEEDLVESQPDLNLTDRAIEKAKTSSLNSQPNIPPLMDEDRQKALLRMRVVQDFNNIVIPRLVEEGILAKAFKVGPENVLLDQTFEEELSLSLLEGRQSNQELRDFIQIQSEEDETLPEIKAAPSPSSQIHVKQGDLKVVKQLSENAEDTFVFEGLRYEISDTRTLVQVQGEEGNHPGLFQSVLTYIYEGEQASPQVPEEAISSWEEPGGHQGLFIDRQTVIQADSSLPQTENAELFGQDTPLSDQDEETSNQIISIKPKERLQRVDEKLDELSDLYFDRQALIDAALEEEDKSFIQEITSEAMAEVAEFTSKTEQAYAERKQAIELKYEELLKNLDEASENFEQEAESLEDDFERAMDSLDQQRRKAIEQLESLDEKLEDMVGDAVREARQLIAQGLGEVSEEAAEASEKVDPE